MKITAPHVHCRDEQEAYKSTILLTSILAKTEGISAIFDMPNTKPPILFREDVARRLKIVEQKGCWVDYHLFIGLTSNPHQIKEAVDLANNHPRVVGLKLFHPEPKIYSILAELGYQRVLAVHCEKESKFKPKLWDPQKSWTHCQAQPPKAEIKSVKEQIKWAQKFKFKGHLHICHISCPESVDLVWKAKKKIRISSGVTPHHLLFSEEKMKQGMLGLLYKVNPPLRDEARRKALLERLKQGKIDWIEPDHAPHTAEEKLLPPYPSGIASIPLYRDCLNMLRQEGMTRDVIEKLTYWNIKEVFKKCLI